MTDFESLIERDTARIQDLLDQIAENRARLIDAEKNTRNLLEIAAAAGVTALGVGKTSTALGMPDWQHFTTHGSIFTPLNERVNGGPAAWHISAAAGVGFGAGNSGQHQAHTESLIDGIYECRGGVWRRTDLESS